MYRSFVLIPDSFKGTLTAPEVCGIWTEVIRRRIPDSRITALPMADGGEGMTDACLRILGGSRYERTVTGPEGRPVTGHYAILPDGTGVTEMAAAAGLPLVAGPLQPMTATTWGVGELLLAMKEQGARRILLGLGGSATTDGGIGMAGALGWRFLDEAGKELEPLAVELGRIRRILPPAEPFGLPVTAACDVDNPLCGPNGAAHVFGPQKGADPAQRETLDSGLAALAEAIHREQGLPVRDVPGAGAAGGLGAGVLAFLDGALRPGIELLLDAAHASEHIAAADMVFTGEGRMDGQSSRGKVPFGVARRAGAAGKPCVALCGSLAPGAEALYDAGITAMYAAVDSPADMETLRRTCREDMRRLTERVLAELIGESK